MAGAEKILVRGVNWLGDAVMTTPALQRLREAKPDARITLLTHEKLGDLWRHHPSLDGVITFRPGQGLLGVSRRLREEQFDGAVIFPNSWRSALEIFLARISRRVGYAGQGRGLFLSQAVPRRPDLPRMRKRSRGEIDRRIAQNMERERFPASAHHAHDYLHLVAALGANPEPLPTLVHVTPEEVAAARDRLVRPKDAPLFALNPGAEYGPAKRWPAERFVAAATMLQERTRCHWIVLGGPADRALAGKIAADIAQRAGAPCTNLAGQTSLRELCATLKACALLLTNDSGPMHVAAAVGTPVVVPSGSTSPELTGPWGTEALPHQILSGDVACAPCFRRECPIDFRCLESIPAEAVVEKASGLWRSRPAG